MSEPVIQCDIAIVGGGPAGLAAACAATESGRRVVLLDDTPWVGGQIWRGEQAKPSVPQAQEWIQRFRKSGATLLDGASVFAAPADNLLLAERNGQSPQQIRYDRLILATGARELFLPFPGWTLPGVTGAGGLQAMVKNGLSVDGKRVVIAGSGPLLLAVADGLRKHGAIIPLVAEQANFGPVVSFSAILLRHPAKLWQAMQLKRRLLGIPYRFGTWPVRAEGDGQVRRIILTNGKREWGEECDYFACGFGLVPNVELPLALGCALSDDGFVRIDEIQKTSIDNIFCAGEPTGIGGVDSALVEGRIAGYASTDATAKARALFEERATWRRFGDKLARTFAPREELKKLAAEDTLLCRCEDVTLQRVRQFGNWRAAKLHTRCGMGPCQGRVCGAAARVLFGWGAESVRPPVLPASVESLASMK